MNNNQNQNMCEMNELIAASGSSSAITSTGGPIKNGMPPIHPGVILKDLYLDEMGISVADFAKHIHTNPCVIQDIITGKRPIEAFSAMLFAAAFGTSVQLWMNLQNTYDIRVIETRNPGFPSFVKPIVRKGE